MNNPNLDPYGACLPVLLYHGLRDRMAGNKAKANARWGRLRPPDVQGKVLWVVTGSTRDSVRLGVELVLAVRAKRLDVRLILTFEEEYPDLLQPLESLSKTGWGYGPADHSIAVNRVLTRLKPLGIIFAGVTPRPNLMRACATISHTLIIAANAPPTSAIEQIYPASEAQAKLSQSHPQAPVVDFFSMLTEAQVDPNFKSLVNHGVERHLWWLHTNNTDYANQFAVAWRSQLPESVLFISGIVSATLIDHALPISQWQRNLIASGSVVLVDDSKWLPAIAAACTAMHLHQLDSPVMWQAMAGGCGISGHDVTRLPKHELSQAITEITDAAAVLMQWQAYRENPILARSRGDEARRQFWKERRLAADINEALLQRIYAW